MLAARKMYYEENKARIIELQKKSRQTNPARVMLTNAKYRAKKVGLAFDLDISDIYVPEVCPILKVPFVIGRRDPYNPSLDRIDNSKGYVKGNIQVISYRANSMKNASTKDELLKLAYWATTSFGLFSND